MPTDLAAGEYRATLAAARVVDLAGNRMAADFITTFRNVTDPHVVARHVFYNNSALDGRDPAITPADLNAIAADKSALLPGQSASFANYTSYSRGINGIAVDLARFGDVYMPSGQEFQFYVVGIGPRGARTDRMPSRYGILRGAGANGTDRAFITWPDGALRNVWLRVTVLRPNSASSVLDTFYVGNLFGDTGGAGPPAVDAADVERVRRRIGTRNSAALRTHDLNRDGVVNATDVLLVRQNVGHTLPAL